MSNLKTSIGLNDEQFKQLALETLEVNGETKEYDDNNFYVVPSKDAKDYDASAIYNSGDIVYYEKNIYTPITDFVTGVLPTDTSKWKKLVEGQDIDLSNYANKTIEQEIYAPWNFNADINLWADKKIHDMYYGAEWNSKYTHHDYQGTRAYFNYDGSFDIESEESNGMGHPEYAKTKFQLPQDEANGVKKTLATREWVNENAGGGVSGGGTPDLSENAEEWTFVLADGTSVTKKVVLA